MNSKLVFMDQSGKDQSDSTSANETALQRNILEPRANWLIRDRNKLAASERSAVAIHYGIPSKLKVTLAYVSPADLESWMRSEVRKSGRMIVKQHLEKQLPEEAQRRRPLRAEWSNIF
jgi:hypothetical protein